MNQFLILILVCISISVPLVYGNLTTITSNGNNLISATPNTILNYSGGGLVSANVINGTIVFSQHSIVTIGTVQQIRWDKDQPSNYIDLQMALKSDNPNYVLLPQQLPGTVTTLATYGVVNNIQTPLHFNLILNGKNTTKGFYILPGMSSQIITISQPFNQGDELYWQVTGKDNIPNSLIFNSQVLIQYTQ